MNTEITAEKTEQIHVRLTESEAKRLKHAAVDQSTSMQSIIANLIRQYLKERSTK